ncbi:MAG: hypothetical protein E4G74_00260 [Erysipelotrichales bacterium]|nr:MAG: hypothetical protein E4G74_00260 [Erysipelotrichales bacterium]
MNKYPPGFNGWLITNAGQNVWHDFEKRALEMAAIRQRYSAMAIAQVIRWHTALRGGDDFKLNNNWVPGLARYWMTIHGKNHPGFFQLRDGLGYDL